MTTSVPAWCRFTVMILALTMTSSLFGGALEEEQSARVVYKAMSALTTPERKLLYTQLPGTTKAALWRLQIQSYVSRHPDLSMEQSALLMSATKLLEGSLFETDSSAPEWKFSVDAPLTILREKASVLFEHDDAVLLFSHLGEPEPMTDVSNERIFSALQGVPPSPHDDCECSKVSDWCWSGSFCNNTYPTCKVVGFGCGTFFSYACDGLCVSPP